MAEHGQRRTARPPLAAAAAEARQTALGAPQARRHKANAERADAAERPPADAVAWPAERMRLPRAGQTSPAVAHRCCGLDEVGRGALAGPLVAAGAILPEDIHARLGSLVRFLRDSKTVPAVRRAEIAAQLHAHALAIRIVVIPVAAINARGIGWANREAFRRLIALMRAEEYIVDGRVRPPAPRDRAGRVRCLVRADAQVPAVSAASLVAKVHRDRLMADLHDRHPTYGWATNVGYGTPAHLAALREHGPCAEHRTLFVATALGLEPPPGRRRTKRIAAELPLFAED